MFITKCLHQHHVHRLITVVCQNTQVSLTSGTETSCRLVLELRSPNKNLLWFSNHRNKLGTKSQFFSTTPTNHKLLFLNFSADVRAMISEIHGHFTFVFQTFHYLGWSLSGLLTKYNFFQPAQNNAFRIWLNSHLAHIWKFSRIIYGK